MNRRFTVERVPFRAAHGLDEAAIFEASRTRQFDLLDGQESPKGAIGTSLSPSDPWPAWARAIVSTVALWLERSRSRRLLAALSDHELGDIGLTRTEAGIESIKPFWRP